MSNARRDSWRLAWPLVLSNLSVPLLGMVDTAVVGHLPDPAQLGAVALGASVASMLYFAFGFLRMGTTALAAQALGGADADELRAVLLRGLGVALAIGLVIVATAPLAVTAGLAIFAPGVEIAPSFEAYVRLRLLGAPAALAGFVLVGWLLGLQDSRRPLALMLATNGLNALLDVLLVFGLGMAADGVALATAMSDYAGLAIGLLILRPAWRRLGGGLPPRAAVLRRERFLRLFRVNRDIFMRSLMLEAAFTTFAALSSRQGELVLAANAVLKTFFTLASFGLDGFAHAAEAMVGRAVGARDRSGFKAAVRAGFVNGALLSVGLAIFLWLGGGLLIDLLTSLEPVRALALVYLPYAAILPLVAVWAFLWDGVFFGATRTAELRNAMILALLVFLAAALALPPLLGNHGLWLALLLFLGARGLFLGLSYRRAGEAFAFPG
ncbi:MATE family efflux transporter [Geminicoccaceae bacterium 1502E]|nr:MATE family efflux transporter [Geminicoccaceae bacterium 1502E]